MSEARAKEPFRFYTSSVLVEITGKKARHLKEFVQALKQIDENSIFYHVHRAFREYSFAPGQYANDFARWVSEDLEEGTLAERLAALNPRDYTEIKGLRERLVELIEEHLNRAVEIRRAPAGREFYFLRGLEVITPTPHEVWSLPEFRAALEQVGMRSLYYHFFDARFRLGRPTNDFSNWISVNFGLDELARSIEQLDPYFLTMDQLKEQIIALCGRRPELPPVSLPAQAARWFGRWLGKKR